MPRPRSILLLALSAIATLPGIAQAQDDDADARFGGLWEARPRPTTNADAWGDVAEGMAHGFTPRWGLRLSLAPASLRPGVGAALDLSARRQARVAGILWELGAGGAVGRSDGQAGRSAHLRVAAGLHAGGLWWTLGPIVDVRWPGRLWSAGPELGLGYDHALDDERNLLLGVDLRGSVQWDANGADAGESRIGWRAGLALTWFP